MTDPLPDAATYSPFVKELARYFMEFLETNFHRRRVPKRAIVERSAQNLLVGVGLARYPRYRAHLWQLLDESAGLFSDLVEAGRYTRPLPAQTLRLLNEKADLLEADSVAALRASIASTVEDSSRRSRDNVETAVERTKDAVSETVRKQLVQPFLDHAEGPLSDLARAGADAIHETETSLTDVVASQLQEAIGTAVRSAILGVDFDLSSSLEQLCTVASCREAIKQFFSGLSVSDLAFDVQELFDNHRILDKQETYLNVGTISFENRTYPIFYTPIRFERAGSRTISLTADAPFYVNKKAIEYIVQQFNQQMGRHGGSGLIDERILYPGDLVDPLSRVLQTKIDLLSNYFELTEPVSLRAAGRSVSRGLLVQLSNDLYLTVFDKSDEALINDYEDILSLIETDGPVAEAFGSVVRSFMNENPPTVRGDTEEEWSALPVPERAVYASPVPLNAEQRKILLALQKPKCRYLAVEGPPGTGKSHTITALVCDAVLAHQSVLILSDKSEALDVVEDKITGALSQIRLPEKEFQNPILRLGKSGSNFAQVLGQASLRKIGDHYRAVKSQEDQLTTQRDQLQSALKAAVADTISSLGDVRLSEIKELLTLEREATDAGELPELTDLLAASDPPVLAEIQEAARRVADFARDPLVQELSIGAASGSVTFDLLAQTLDLLAALAEFREQRQNDLDAVRSLASPDPAQLDAVNRIVAEYNKLTAGIFGSLFKRKKIAALEARLQTECHLAEAANLRRRGAQYLRAAGTLRQLEEAHSRLAPVPVLHRLLLSTNSLEDITGQIRDDIESLARFIEVYPTTAASLGLNATDVSNLPSSQLLRSSRAAVQAMDRRVALQRKLQSAFADLPILDYAARLENLERLKTHEMAHLLDGRVLRFAEQEKATAQTLKEIIRKRKRFPRDLFGSLREAFPCIIASIRDYAEYIPLEPNLFDLVVIDEASQVSIAQAFPALLRGKTIVVFGDRKQFSNVKSATAKSEINLEWKARLRAAFTTSVSTKPTHLVRLDKFDIKTSILDFFDYVANFDIMLRKYFRGYAEHISYSNRYFYRNELQAIRLRTQSLEEAVKFTVLEHDGLIDPVANTNTREAEFILKQLVEMKDRGDTRTVGIITPHTNQQKHIAALVSSHDDRDFLLDELRVKVMTFDTCQGEERDVVFYSMVASAASDKLWAIFVKDLEKVDLEENGQIKAQRLNVGFSRAKECMHFVLSKEPGSFQGAVGDALRHYQSILRNAPIFPTAAEVDPSSPKEAQVLQWLQQTPFYRRHSNRIEVRAQFPLGDALRQLDPSYQHPSYRVDFLLLYSDPGGKTAKVILEYDGFAHHFRDRELVTEVNFDQYYTADDVERQLVLESYGYRFVRLNRFNCGGDPVAFLSGELERITEKKAGVT